MEIQIQIYLERDNVACLRISSIGSIEIAALPARNEYYLIDIRSLSEWRNVIGYGDKIYSVKGGDYSQSLYVRTFYQVNLPQVLGGETVEISSTPERIFRDKEEEDDQYSKLATLAKVVHQSEFDFNPIPFKKDIGFELKESTQIYSRRSEPWHEFMGHKKPAWQFLTITDTEIVVFSENYSEKTRTISVYSPAGSSL